MNDLKFYCKYLLLNENQFDIETFNESILNNNPLVFYENGTYHHVNIKVVNDFVQIYLEYGNPLPRPEHVINTETTQNEDNPRTEAQIEPKQMFVLIDSRHSVAWFSNIKKSSILATIFTKLGIRSEIKNIYNAEDFIEKIKSINGIKLATTPETLFNATKLKHYLNNDIYGYGASSAILELKYHKTVSLEGDLMENLRDLFSNRVSFDTFIVSGKDDGNMDVVFNNESLVEKIFLDIKPLPSGEYLSDEVFSKLIGSIQ